jgi:hypothetical protein
MSAHRYGHGEGIDLKKSKNLLIIC